MVAILATRGRNKRWWIVVIIEKQKNNCEWLWFPVSAKQRCLIWDKILCTVLFSAKYRQYTSCKCTNRSVWLETLLKCDCCSTSMYHTSAHYSLINFPWFIALGNAWWVSDDLQKLQQECKWIKPIWMQKSQQECKWYNTNVKAPTEVKKFNSHPNGPGHAKEVRVIKLFTFDHKHLLRNTTQHSAIQNSVRTCSG